MSLHNRFCTGVRDRKAKIIPRHPRNRARCLAQNIVPDSDQVEQIVHRQFGPIGDGDRRRSC